MEGLFFTDFMVSTFSLNLRNKRLPPRFLSNREKNFHLKCPLRFSQCFQKVFIFRVFFETEFYDVSTDRIVLFEILGCHFFRCF